MRRGDDSTDVGRPGKRADRRSTHEPGADAASPLTYIFSRRAIRELDRLAVEEFGLPSIVLMENAAIGLAGAVSHLLESAPMAAASAGGSPTAAPVMTAAEGNAAGNSMGTILVVAGRGNNGGDGLAAARHLHNEGRRVAVVLASPPADFTGDAAANLSVVRAMGIPLRTAEPDNPRAAINAAVEALGTPDIVLDALLGTGLKGRISGVYADLIAAANALRAAGASVVAADLPSGLDADSGEPLGQGADPAVRADLTVTFVGLKEGFLALTAQEFLGEVVVSPIGAPMELTRRLGRAVAVTEHPGERPGEGGVRSRRRPLPPAPRIH